MIHMLRFICAWLLAQFLIFTGFVNRAVNRSFHGDYILSIYFHRPSKQEFERCIRWLKKRKFNFLTTDDILQISENNKPIPSGAVILTVDDGWLSNKECIVEVALHHCVPVTIFVSTQPVEEGVYWWSVIEEAQKRKLCRIDVEQLKLMPNTERMQIVNSVSDQIKLDREAMTIEDVKQVASSRWVTIGAHTVTHPILNQCSTEQVIYEVEESRAKLQEWTNNPIHYFAYPNGDYSSRETRLLEDSGYKLAFAVRADYLTESALRNRYELPRFEVVEQVSFAETICRMTGVWEPFVQRTKHFLGLNKKSRVLPVSVDSYSKSIPTKLA